MYSQFYVEQKLKYISFKDIGWSVNIKGFRSRASMQILCHLETEVYIMWDEWKQGWARTTAGIVDKFVAIATGPLCLHPCLQTQAYPAPARRSLFAVNSRMNASPAKPVSVPAGLNLTSNQRSLEDIHINPNVVGHVQGCSHDSFGSSTFI